MWIVGARSVHSNLCPESLSWALRQAEAPHQAMESFQTECQHQRQEQYKSIRNPEVCVMGQKEETLQGLRRFPEEAGPWEGLKESPPGADRVYNQAESEGSLGKTLWGLPPIPLRSKSRRTGSRRSCQNKRGGPWG